MNKKNIAVLVSGGVDSSVALSILKNQGHSITAFYIKIWLEDELNYLGNCPWEEDTSYIKTLCINLEIPFEIISMQKDYWDIVVNYTINSVKIGNTPNPDIFCNREIKLGLFLKKYGKDFDYIATGHYARRIEFNNEVFLCTTDDKIKDQTYFLSYTPLEALKKVLFPIGNMEKYQVRDYAKNNNLPSAHRADSQGICFLGNIKFKDFIKYYCGTKTGNIICYDTGKILGQHDGFWFYTIGQRSGIGLSHGPWYVIDKDIKENIIYVSTINSKKRIEEINTIFIYAFNWLISEKYKFKVNDTLLVKLRHGPFFNECIISELNNEYIKIILKDKDQGIANGQFAVFYKYIEEIKETICFGAGEIKV